MYDNINETIKNLQLKLIGKGGYTLEDKTVNPMYFTEGWSFLLCGKVFEKDVKILADNNEITESYTVKIEYIKNETDFIKECKRFYNNRLCDLN